MSTPVSGNGTPWNQLPGATGGIRKNLTRRPSGQVGGNFFGDLFGGLVRAIMGIFIPGGDGGHPILGNPLEFLSDIMGERWDQVDEIDDGQKALNNRMDLVEDVSGYCNLVQDGTQNIPYNWGTTYPYYLAWHMEPIGPTKNASRANTYSPRRGWVNGIAFDSWGTWIINVQTLSVGAFTIGGSARMNMGIYVLDLVTDNIYTQKLYYNETPGFHRTHQLEHKVVIPEGGRYVAFVGVRSNRTTFGINFAGSDTFTSFSVNRIDIRTDGALNPPPHNGLADPP